MTITKPLVFKYFLLLGLLLSSFLFWLELKSPTSFHWGSVLFYSSLLFLFWSFLIFVFPQRSLFWSGSFFIVIPNLILSLTVPGLFFSFLGLLFFIWAGETVKSKMSNQIKLDIWNSFRVGHRLFSLALTLVILGYVLLPNLLSGRQVVIPPIEISEKHLVPAERLISAVDPHFDFQQFTSATVADYILQQAKISRTDNPYLRREAITSGEKELSTLAGRKVRASEKINSVLLEIVNKKINSYFHFDNHRELNKLGFWLVLLITFIAIYSLASFVTSILILVFEIILRLLIAGKFLKVSHRDVLKEIITI